MTTKVEKSVEVNVPVSTAYNQWTQFEEFPQFMGGVSEVRQLDDQRLHWVAEIAGVKREWEATILEQVPDQKVAWAATQGATNAGAVYFTALGADRTSVRLSLEYEPEGLVEKAGDMLNIIEKRAEADLKKFKSFIESRGSETGSWRGGVNEGAAVGTPGVEAAAFSEGDSGKSGVSAKAVAAGVAGVAAAAAGVAAATGVIGGSGNESTSQSDEGVSSTEGLSSSAGLQGVEGSGDITYDTSPDVNTSTSLGWSDEPEAISPLVTEGSPAGSGDVAPYPVGSEGGTAEDDITFSQDRTS